jgi:CysZ protein
MIEAFRAVFGGIWFVVTTPRMWVYAAVPALLLVILACGLGGLGIYGGIWTTHALLGEPEGVWGQMGGWLLATLLALTALLLALMTALLLAQPLSGFALEAVALAQERALCGCNAPRSSFLAALWASTRATLLMLLAGAILYSVLFLVDLLFAPAAFITVPLRFVIAGWLLAWNFLDYPLSLRGLGVLARLRWSVRYFEEFTVFGVLWATLLFVPGLFFLILPMGVAGATRLVVETEQQEAYEAEVDSEEDYQPEEEKV